MVLDRASDSSADSGQYLWYIPNTVEAGHRGDDVTEGLTDLDRSSDLARLAEAHRWAGALIGAGWGRPDTFTVAAVLAARTRTFRPLIAIRPGFWSAAQFASAAATLDQASRGRVLVNVVTGLDDVAAYGDTERDPTRRYAEDAGVHPVGAATVERGGGHLPGRVLPGRGVDAGASSFRG